MDRPASLGVVELDQFVAANLISFAAWDLLIYLAEHPAFEASPDQISTMLTRGAGEIQRVLDHMTETGLLEPQQDGGTVRFRLVSDPRQRADLALFAEAARDRNQRLELVRHVMGHMSI